MIVEKKGRQVKDFCFLFLKNGRYLSLFMTNWKEPMERIVMDGTGFLQKQEEVEFRICRSVCLEQEDGHRVLTDRTEGDKNNCEIETNFSSQLRVSFFFCKVRVIVGFKSAEVMRL